jgi:hypothetical protein
MVQRVINIFYNIILVFSLITPLLIVASFYDSRYDILNYLMASCIAVAFLWVVFSFLLSFIGDKTINAIFYNKDQRVEFPWSIDDYANKVPSWILFQSAIYSAMIPQSSKMPKIFKDRKRFSDRVVESNDRITKVLTNESVVDVLYNGYAPDMKNEMEAFVRKTFRDEFKVLRQIRSEMRDVVSRENEIRSQEHTKQMEREESERRAARDAKDEDVRIKANKMLDENYLSEADQEKR